MMTANPPARPCEPPNMATRELDAVLARRPPRLHARTYFVGPLKDLYDGLPPFAWPAVSRAYARGLADAKAVASPPRVPPREADAPLPFERTA